MAAFLRQVDAKTLILSGVGLNQQPNEAIVERALAREAKVLFAYDVEPGWHPNFPVEVADGRDLPYTDCSADVIVANAVIEHVGDEADQRRFVAEQARVGRHWIITTPNKWFPVESHTSAVFVHWFPAWRHKHYADFTRLLSLREFRALLPADAHIVGRPWSPTFTAYSSPPPSA